MHGVQTPSRECSSVHQSVKLASESLQSCEWVWPPFRHSTAEMVMVTVLALLPSWVNIKWIRKIAAHAFTALNSSECKFNKQNSASKWCASSGFRTYSLIQFSFFSFRIYLFSSLALVELSHMWWRLCAYDFFLFRFTAFMMLIAHHFNSFPLWWRCLAIEMRICGRSQRVRSSSAFIPPRTVFVCIIFICSVSGSLTTSDTLDAHCILLTLTSPVHTAFAIRMTI